MDQYQGINAMPYYCGSSFEELRVQDYSETGKFKDSFDDRKAWRDPLFTSLDDSVDGTDENSTKGDEDDEECPYIQDLKLCKRCEKLWYPDGNIVFHAADTIYRIHHSILSIHSRVFKDIFEKPFSDESHDTEVESFENCLVVRLLDSPKEIESLLMTIYYPFHFQESSHSYTFLDAALRVSTKYNFDTLRVNVLSKLTPSFPSTLEAFDELSRYPDRLRDSQKKALSVINLARYTSCFEFLPSAFYLCSRLSAQTILRGKGKNDTICAEDAATCIIGREELIKTWNKRTHEFLYEKPSISVFRRASCSECPKHTNEKLLEYLQAKDGAELFGLDQFDTWDVIGLCSKCAIPLQTKHQESRQQLWEQLPKVFGLGSWDELRTKQALREA
ncbi:hypothetical protein BJ138DRAFT_750886 [Hygrophoropsis aurantiaca]|uniref:Uncharacterized protein n=1 Tax=Hygrophoropsis aurantiaca TaxID=72124 RepID=A0ACB8AHF7_9AGAM|nr:hypothetical protein BJ138DRAFT_750886 [Hygrophoropsis aurantiaca]